MEQVICKRAATVEFWDGYARWYKLWMEHNHYHDRIIDILMTVVEPGWKVLDIGAGNGVLSMPLCAIGCEVTVLEPSTGMRKLLYEEAFKRSIDWIHIDERTWEAVSSDDFRDYDLIMACNSLHLTRYGFDTAVKRIFQFNPRHVFVVSELYPGIEVKETYGNHAMNFTRYYETESSFAYHGIDEAVEHWTFKKGREPYAWELAEIQSQLIYRDDHLLISDIATVGMFWWEHTIV